MLSLRNLLSPRKDAPEDSDLADSRRWVKEAENAEQEDDWVRAVVCYRRAIDLAPFNPSLRDAFEDALEEHILRQTDKEVLDAIQRAEWEADQEDSEQDDSDLPEFEDVVPEPRTRRAAKPQRIPRPAPIPVGRAARELGVRRRRVMLAVAACLAILLTTGGVISAAMATGFLRNAFTSANLPSLIVASLPPGLERQLTEANERLRAQNAGEAVEILRQAAREFPEHEHDVIRPALASAVRLNALEQMRGNNFANAAETFEEATRLDPQNPLNWIDLGRALRDHARTGSAANNPARQKELLTRSEEAFTRALALSPRDRSALYGMAQVYDAKNDRRKAIETYERLVSIAPDSVEGQMARANLTQLRQP